MSPGFLLPPCVSQLLSSPDFLRIVMRAVPFPRQPAPTHMVTFRHPAGNKNVIVPFTFPQGIPRIETRSDRIIYNWGSYQVQARFLPDGSVDVLYNSGVLRPISFQ